LFRPNPKKVFERTELSTDVPDPESTLMFWKALWEKPALQRTNAEWLDTITDELYINQLI